MENELNFLNHAGTLATSRLGDLCERVVRKNTDNQSKLPLTISSVDGLVDQRDYFNKIVAAKDMSGYYLLKRGEFAYNKSYSVGYDYGSIKRLNRYDEGCLSTLYICFAIKSDLIDSDYLEWFFNSLFWYKEMPNICAEGARNHGLLNVDTDEFFNLSIIYPVDIEEQRKIAKILNSLDAKIASEKIETEKLKNLKSSMLTKMFPKEGEKVPEIRFDGFTDDWEQRKLKEILIQRTEHQKISDDAPLLAFSYAEGVISPEDKKSNKRDFIMTDKYNKIFSRTELNDIIYNPANVIHGAIHRNKLGTGVVSPIYKIFMCNGISPKFIGERLHTDKFILEVTKFIEGTVVKLRTLSPEMFLEMSIEIPKSYEEQDRIGTYFTNLENLITLHQHKYEKLLDVKKAMLSKLIGGAN